MASLFLLRAFAALWLLAGSAHATAWTVTSYYAVTVTTSAYSGYTDEWAQYTYTDTLTVKPTADVTASPVSTYTSVDTYYDIKRVEVYYDATDVDSSDFVPTSTYDEDYYSTYSAAPYTYYYQEILYTAPASCPTSFTVKTYTNVYIPTEVVDQITPKSTTTRVSSYADGDRYTVVTVFLSEGEVSLTTESSSADFIETYYLADCRNPTATGDAYWGNDDDGGYYDDDDDSSSGGGGGSGQYRYNTCSVLLGCSNVKSWIIAIATIIPGLFLLGFLESYLWFRRMMLGKGALRLGTICWVCISLLIACFTRHTPARNAADRPALREKWAAMTMRTRIGLWFKWGFRHSYPVELLGPDPRTTVAAKPGDDTPPPMQYVPYPQYVQYPQYPMNTQPPMNMQYSQYPMPMQPIDMNNPMYMQQQMNTQPPTNMPSTMDTPSPLNTPPPVHRQNTTNTQPPATTPSPLDSQPPLMTTALHNEPPVNQERSVDAPAETGQVAPHQQPPPPRDQ